MNITLSADEPLIRSTRRYARQKHTTLNNLLRQYMQSVTRQDCAARSAEEFRQLAMSRSGVSAEGFCFNRDDAHTRADS